MRSLIFYAVYDIMLKNMNFVFFDIECAGVHKTYAKICAFGYVVCDADFNILQKEDILINPRGKFELTDRKGEKGIVLPYDYSQFSKCPQFREVYPEIKALLEDKNNIVMGHAVLNDVKYLNLETRRFGLPSFNFSFYDSQLLFMASGNDFSRQFGLEYIADALGVEFTPHRAADDAYATMRITEALCKKHGCGFEELKKLFGCTAGRIADGTVNPPQCAGFKKYKKEKSEAKRIRSESRVKFYNNLSRKRRRKQGRLAGKRFNFSRKIEDDTEISIPFVDLIYDLGGSYRQRVDECTHYVSPEGDETDRTKKARECGKIMLSLKQFEELLNG